MSDVAIEKELKRDGFGTVELIAWKGADGGAVRVVRRVVSAKFGLGLIGRLLARRESRALAVLEGSGVTPIAEPLALDGEFIGRLRALPTRQGEVPRARSVFIRPFAEGLPLHRAEILPHDFFDLLESDVRSLHSEGVCHNDLHKEQNIVVSPGGRPILIDFQLATRHPKRRGRWFRARCADDLRHIQKHRRRYTRDGRGPAELRVADSDRMPRRGIPFVWKRFGKPIYKFVTRKVLRTRDGEEMRPSSGPWPRWTEPIGMSDAGRADRSARVLSDESQEHFEDRAPAVDT